MASPSIQTGCTLGRYRVLEQIGAGGMGVIFRAHDVRLQRDVAIKVLHPGSIRSSVARHRVRNEAMALSRISHPNIETIFEFDTQGDTDFLVVELIRGKGIDVLASHGSVPASDAIALSKQLLSGLGAAHDKNIIHRDLKPSNLRLTPDGFLKILDFGLAHVHDASEEIAEFTTESHSSVLSGTLPYISPEQLRGVAPDPRSDLYAVGVILYQLCTGRLPFLENGAMLIDAILNHTAPRPRKLNREIPAPLESVILKGLEKNPKWRYQSAREMLADLEDIESGSKRSARWLLPTTAALLAIAVTILGTVERGRIASAVENRLHPVPPNRYVAVLPFQSANNDDTAFDQGLTESVASKLMEITAAQPVQIVSPRDLQAEHVSTLDDARKKLGVNLVIEGALQQQDGNTRVSLDLVDTSTRRAVRAANFITAAGDVFALEDRVIQTASELLEIEIHKGLIDETHGTTNAEGFRLFERGRGLLQNGSNPEDTDSAIAQFQQALEIDPGYADAYASLGMSYLQKYQTEKKPELVTQSRDQCSKATILNAHLAAANVCLGNVQLTTGDYEQAASSFKMAIAKDPQQEDAYRLLATVYEHMGRTEDAEETYKKAIAIRPQYAIGYSRLGLLYSRETRYGLAAQELQHATALTPDDPRTWASLGGVYYLAGKYPLALQTLQHAVAIRPSYPGYNNLGASYFALRRMPEAIAAFERALATGANQIQSHGNLARAYYWYPPKRALARDQYVKAMQLVDEALKVNPKDADAHTLAAQYCAMLGRRAEALRHLNAALQARPEDAETLYFAAIVHSQLGEKQQAASWLKKALDHGYSPAEIALTPELDGIQNHLR